MLLWDLRTRYRCASAESGVPQARHGLVPQSFTFVSCPQCGQTLALTLFSFPHLAHVTSIGVSTARRDQVSAARRIARKLRRRPSNVNDASSLEGPRLRLA